MQILCHKNPLKEWVMGRGLKLSKEDMCSECVQIQFIYI